MRVTALTTQVRDKNRINVSIDGKYRFSLDITQIVDFGIKIGREYSDAEIAELERESQYGKLYARALEYVLMRPRSKREVGDYLYRKTRTTKVRNRQTGEWKERLGVEVSLTQRVLERLIEKGYVDDAKFARYWIENRHQRKGISQRQLAAELMAKGVDRTVIEQLMQASERTDLDELRKVVAKKSKRYDEPQKLKAYLMRLGFRYDDINEVLAEEG